MDEVIINLYKEKDKKLNISFYLAHHDDETLFYMGLLLFLKEYKKIIENINIIIFTNILSENTNYTTQNKKLINFKEIIKKLGNINYKCLNFNNKIVNEGYEKLDIIEKKITEITKNIKIVKKYRNLHEKNIKKKLILKRLNLREKINNFNLEENLDIDYTKYTNILSNIENKIESDIIFTHNEFGEYGHKQHKLVYLLIKNLKLGIWKNKLIYTTSNYNTKIKLSIDKKVKQDFLKMYDFKDTKDKKNIWFNQTLKNYSYWADNDFEYYKLFSLIKYL